jgi:hypothetical protein
MILKMQMQMQDLKSNHWGNIKQAKEAGVPGVDEIAAAFVKQHF